MARRRDYVAWITIALLGSLVAVAVLGNRQSEAVETDSDRLPPVATTASKDVPPWAVEKRTDPNGSAHVRAWVYADEPIRFADGESREPRLVARCREGRTELFITLGVGGLFRSHDPASAEPVATTYQLDDQPPVTQPMPFLSDPRRFAFAQPVATAQKLRAHQRLTVEAHIVDAGSQHIEFDIRNATEALAQVAAACGGW